MYFKDTIKVGDLQAIYYNFVCRFKNNFVIKRFRVVKILAENFRGRIPADVYFPAILKWAKREGQERAFLLKKWRKNGEKTPEI